MRGNTLAWSSLPGEVVARILQTLDETTLVNLAATSSHSAWDVFLLPRVSIASKSPVLLSHLAESLPKYHRSRAYLAGTIHVGQGVWVDAVAALSALTFPLPDHIKTPNALVDYLAQQEQDLQWTIRKIKIVGQSCPANLTGLRKVDVSECSSLAADWLPASSGGNVEVLHAWCSTSLVRLPEGMVRLRMIDVSECDNLASDWLPESYGSARIRVVC